MSALAPSIKGWCPGALTPMPTGDGLLARVRASSGRLDLDQARGVAECARACGNGAIELTSRGNLQLRGIREAALPELHERLARLGLVDDDPRVERARNIVASPLADLDPEAAFDVGPIVAALEARIANEPALRALPTKFSFVIDAGGRWPLGDVDADIRFQAAGTEFVVMLAGDASGLAHSHGELPEIAARLAGAFLALAGDGPVAPRRMPALTRRDGAATVFRAAGLSANVTAAPSRATIPRDIVGPLRFPAQIGLGAAPPFGRVDAGAFAGLVHAARRRGAAGLRLTPWRVVVAIGLDALGAARLADDVAALGFITSPDDSRLGVVACPGAPACAHAGSEAPADARVLAAALAARGGVALHVSGCAKGCARAAATPVTLTATPRGYDLILNGRAGDAPARHGLTLSEAAAFVGGLAA
jgi:precorrin-3B synthase